MMHHRWHPKHVRLAFDWKIFGRKNVVHEFGDGSSIVVGLGVIALPEIKSSDLPGSHPKRKQSSSNYPFSGVNCYFQGG